MYIRVVIPIVVLRVAMRTLQRLLSSFHDGLTLIGNTPGSYVGIIVKRSCEKTFIGFEISVRSENFLGANFVMVMTFSEANKKRNPTICIWWHNLFLEGEVREIRILQSVAVPCCQILNFLKTNLRVQIH